MIAKSVNTAGSTASEIEMPVEIPHSLRPLQIANYDQPDAASLAAAYAYGLAKNHGFADGNKRTAWVLARLFLADNGYHLTFDKLNAVDTMERVAGGQLSEHELADWIRHRLTHSNPDHPS